MRFVKSSQILKVFYDLFIFHPAPVNLTYFWNFGVYSLVCLAIQIISGIFLAMYYISDISLAFISVEHIMRDIQYGWLVRYIHANGASAFFIVFYIYIGRGLYFFSYLYPRDVLWNVGVLIFLLMIITAFLGYVLPWGQMSFWGATVITNFVSAVPIIGNKILIWIWGGYAVDSPTLTRFFSLHYLLPFVILGLVFLHLMFLNKVGSNNPYGVEFKGLDHISMYPYYIYKDLFGLCVFFFLFFVFIFFYPNLLGHSDNSIPANPLVTPTHIVPEWYFLVFYAILRSIPDKLFGVLIMLFSILIYFFIPYIDKCKIRVIGFRSFISRIFFFIFIYDCFLLCKLGACVAEYPYIVVSQVATFYYFFYWLVLIHIINRLEVFAFINTCNNYYSLFLFSRKNIMKRLRRRIRFKGFPLHDIYIIFRRRLEKYSILDDKSIKRTKQTRFVDRKDLLDFLKFDSKEIFGYRRRYKK